MNNQQQNPEAMQTSAFRFSHWKTTFTTVTSLSKLLALAIFVALPFVGFWLGMQFGVYSPEQSVESKTVAEPEAPVPEKVRLVNPASQDCLEQGGTLEIRTNKMGQYGVCLFEDNRQCEEWALFRGECPVGGLKVTGYDNEAEIYCAITGGEVERVGTDTPMCKRVDGTYCIAQANMDGECPDPNDAKPSAGNVEVR